MKYRRRIYCSSSQPAEIWDRWQRGESMKSIGRVFDRQSSSVYSVISPTGGIRPADSHKSLGFLVENVQLAVASTRPACSSQRTNHNVRPSGLN
ncbi:hypothetical protein SAMN04488032_101619 [Pacificibacter marinus]|uniref:Transposase IS30-like HTH domain-containing protein n=1 Tax=Pacificibacter marinus TaxID=658057 RepID=A0A1Y5RAW1_9RHOB|nr:hypothetical protein SAMN04488032_101619 [Pacificibacter marinus]SLN10625.1 hypothetical protein PAM7971_00028 [Pacificibacter marinus]